MKPPGNKTARARIRLSVPRVILLLVLFIPMLIIFSIPVLTEAKRTSGNLSFIDGMGGLINGAIEISMTGAPPGGRSNVNSISWRNAPNAWIYFDAHETKGTSINLRISGDSPDGRVYLENYGDKIPGNVGEPVPGTPVKYVELRSSGVLFASADVTVHYNEAELNGADEKSLVIYSYAGGAWNELPSKVDPDKNVVTATVDSLSVFAVSAGVPDEIAVRDTMNKPVVSRIRAYDNSRNLIRETRSSALATANFTGNELEVDALESRNVTVRLKLKGANKGKILLDDFGKNNPVSVPLPGRVVKYVEIGARNISFSYANLTIRYTDAELNGGSEDALTIYHWNGASWDAVPTVIDMVNKTVSATTTSLSSWGVATTYTYYFENNATVQSVGADGNTEYSTSGTTITAIPYDNLLDLGPMGTQANIRYTTTVTTEVQIFRFYLPFNYSKNTRISANSSFTVNWRAVGTNDRINVSLIDYNPVTGAKTVIGNKTLTTTGGTTTTSYSSTIIHPDYTVPAGNRLMFRINTTTPTTGTVRLYFNDLLSYITVAEANMAYDISGYITNKSSGLPLSGVTVQTNTSLTATTDASGYYIITGVSNGTYIVSASLYGYDTNSTSKTISGADVANANISLSPSASYQLSGYVSDQSSGNPISGAIITTNTSLTGITNSAGYYSFTVYNWTHLITALKTGYTSNSTTKTVNGADVSNANISLLSLQPRIIVAVNRYVILDDPISTGKTAQTSAGFGLPWTGSSSWTQNAWTTAQTQISGYALLLDENGKPINNTNVTFTMTNWNGADTTTSPNIKTDSNGLANYTFDMNAKNYYGNWNITATAIGKSSATGFIYNWWGCNAAGCRNHGTDSPGTATASRQNSPYTLGRETITANGNHASITDTGCAGCHRSYGGNGSGTQFSGQPTKTSDVHVTDTCATCHGAISTHDTDEPIKSCTDCHTRTDLSEKGTMAGSPLRSNYSGLVASTGHNPNSTIPCIICHGPFHNITKPDETQRFIKNDNTEDTHCTYCHQSYNEHNVTVSCTLCHSDDVHYIQVFARNATGGAYYMNVTNLANPPSNCTLCHQNGTIWFNSLKNLTNAGSYSGRNPPQVSVPLEHSNNNSAGTRWNQTPGYWTNSIQLTWCLYCHGSTTHSATALGIPAEFNGINVVNSSISLTSSWCSSCHWQGYINGSDNYQSTVSAITGVSLPVPPEITGNATYGANKTNPAYFNHSGIIIKSDSSCYGCHRNGTSAISITGFMHNLTDVSTRISGPDCIGCHDYTRTDTDALHRINNSDMKKGVHADLNKNATNSTNISADNKKCWGCHTSNGSEPRPYYLNYYNMGDRFSDPYECYECHNSTGKAYTNVSSAPAVYQHFKVAGNVTAASNASDNSSSCIVCHDLSELKVSYNENDIYNSGLSNASHYTTNRTDLRTWDAGKAANCSYCHQNTSTAFDAAMLDPAYNRSIQNHSTADSPVCYNATCHSSGWIHNSTLARPPLNDTNASSYCRNCHPDKWEHNNTLDCSSCHFNSSSKDTIHPVKYLLQDASYSTSNSTAVTCITCHQSAAVDAKLLLVPPKVPSPLHHSDNASNGTIWNSTSYWKPASPLTACIYCHNDTKHNISALGRPYVWQGNNVVNSSLASGTWCASCHYKNYTSGGRNYSDMTRVFTSANLTVPPEITNGSYAVKIFNSSNYYNHSLKDYTDGACRLCHGINISSSAASDLMHNISGTSCTGCHYSFDAMNNTTRPDRYVDSGMYNTSLHRSLSCTSCHTQGHKNMGARKACEGCHAVQSNPITEKDRHNITPTPSTYSVGGNNVVVITDCTTCHDSALYNMSISTYGYWKPKNCDYCHTYPDKYYE